MNNNVRVSVAMATYNGESFLREQIDSILINLTQEDQLVISDDGSTDATLQIINEYQNKDTRIILLNGPKLGVVKNFENAIAHCDGKYIFLSDQDDIWVNNKVEQVLLNLDDYILVCHNAHVYNQKKNQIQGTTQNMIGCHDSVFKNLLKNSFIGCCMAFRRELIDVVTPFPDIKEIHIHDWWIGLMALKTGKVFFDEQCLIKYRIHSNNTLGFKKTSLAFKISKRLHMCIALKKYAKRCKIVA